MTAHLQDDHDLGLQHDLLTIAAQMRARRRVLGYMVAGGASALLAACGGGSDSASATTAATGSTSSGTTGTTSGTTTGTTTTTTTTGTTSNATTCAADPSETNGPYPSDGSNTVNGSTSNVLLASGIVRSDIRSSFGSASGVAPGVPLTLTLTLVNSNNNCSVLANAAIYIWHCTRDGLYSLYSNGVQAENYLRGVQVTNASGQVTFTTIYPGCYSGRYPHIHFEVYRSLALATSNQNQSLTSQFAMPRDISSTVYASSTGYSASVNNLNAVTIASDNVFGDNTAAQIAMMTPTLTGSVASGYTGTATVGVALS